MASRLSVGRKVSKSAKSSMNGLLAPHKIAHGPEEYPRVEVGRGLTVQLMLVTPEIAAEMLQKLGKKQRSQKQMHLKAIMDDMAAGRFRLNGETIIFAADGTLIDGQHRLTSCVKMGVSFWTLVVRGVPTENFTTIGSGAKRSGADALTALNYTNSRILAAAANLLCRYRDGVLSRERLVLSPTAIEAVMQDHPGLDTSARAVHRIAPLCHGAAAPAFCHYVLSQIDEDDASEFFDKLASLEGMKKGHPILSLAKRFIRGKHRPDNVVFMIFKAWNAWRQGKTLGNILVHEGERFPTPV